MIDFTPIARKHLVARAEQAIDAAVRCEETQRATFDWLIAHGNRTDWGRKHGLGKFKTYEDFAQGLEIRDYERFRPYAMRMVKGEHDVLWPGRTTSFAQSSGTTGGKSKYVPITSDALKRNHYAGAALSVAMYLRACPDSRIFSGKGMILGGSFANELTLARGVKLGDLSATLISHIDPIVNFFRVPDKRIALMPNWEEKLPALVEASRHSNITNISGVPSWFLTVLKKVIETEGAETIHDVWPNLEVFFHGGISFKPYREEYRKITLPTMRFWENYNASEGFFAVQAELDDPAMMLLQNTGVFYEFLPLTAGDDYTKAVPAWAVEQGKTYALVITSCNGLWRCNLGDTVKIEGTNPLKITIAGRTKSYINAFGEEVMEHNADAAIEQACKQCGCSIYNYTAAPVYSCGTIKGRHQWLIEWDEAPTDIDAFVEALDKALQQENSDYEAKRKGNIFLDRPVVESAEKGLFDQWLKSTGKLGGQRKVPRLSNDRRLITQLLEMNANSQQF